MGRISGKPDQNSKPSTIIWDDANSTTFAQEGDSLLGAAFVQILDGSGNPIISFGGGTQYTDGGVPPAHPIGSTIEWSDGANWQTVSNAQPLPITVKNTSLAVTGTFWQTTQPVSLASVPSHNVTNAGTFAVQATEADGANTTLGSKADAKSTATDTTAITIMQVLKQISASVQAPPSQAVTNAGTFAVQAAQSGTWNVGALTSITNVVHVDDNSGSLTIDAPVGTPVFVTPTPSTTGGWTPSSQTALSNTKTSIKGSAGNFGGYMLYNPNASVTYIQVFDATTGNVTVGSTTPTYVIPLPGSAAANVEFGNGINHANAITVAATTTPTGSTAAGSALVGFFLYK